MVKCLIEGLTGDTVHLRAGRLVEGLCEFTQGQAITRKVYW